MMLIALMAFFTCLSLLLNFLMFSCTLLRMEVPQSPLIHGWSMISCAPILFAFYIVSSFRTRSCASRLTRLQSSGSNFIPCVMISSFSYTSFSDSNGGYPHSST